MKDKQYINRVIGLDEKLARKSQFLIGPRQTGKTSYIRNEVKETVSLSWNLLERRLQMQALADPGLLRQTVEERGLRDCLIVIDEIQKAPQLLEEVHALIEERNIRFLLTGSSARKLRQGGVNLLGGRAGRVIMHPLVFPEIRHTGFTLEHVFLSGLLPAAFLSDAPQQALGDYVDVYLTEEIQAEGASRKLAQFVRFLEIAALSSGQLLNYTNIANDVGISRQTVADWYRILLDTLIGYELPSFQKGRKRKTYGMPRFYFFDVGVARILKNTAPPDRNQTEYGEFFEHYVFMELRAYLDYTQSREALSYWRTTSDIEVDFVIGEMIAIEVKTTRKTDARDYRGLTAFMEEGDCERYILVCMEEQPRKLESGIEIMPWKYFLDSLWSGGILRNRSDT